MKLLIQDVEQKFDKFGQPRVTKSGKNHYKVTLAEDDGKNYVAYGDWIADWAGKVLVTDVKDDEYMGNAYSIIWEPKGDGKGFAAKNPELARKLHRAVEGEENEEVTTGDPDEQDEATADPDPEWIRKEPKPTARLVSKTSPTSREPDWDAITHGKIFCNLLSSYVAFTGDIDPSEEVIDQLDKLTGLVEAKGK